MLQFQKPGGFQVGYWDLPGFWKSIRSTYDGESFHWQKKLSKSLCGRVEHTQKTSVAGNSDHRGATAPVKELSWHSVYG